MRVMYCFGDWRSETFSFSPRASRSRSRWRIFSRSSATDFMRLLSVSGDSSGMASVSTVATAATLASIMAMNLASCILAMRRSSMTPRSKIEVDHLLHHKDADRHPCGAAGHHHAAEVGHPKQFDVVRAGDIDERADADRQRADDRRRSLGFHRHGLDFGLHLLAVAQHPGQVSERFGQVAAGLLLDRNDDAEEVGLGQRHPLVELGASLADRHADGLGLDDRLEFAL